MDIIYRTHIIGDDVHKDEGGPTSVHHSPHGRPKPPPVMKELDRNEAGDYADDECLWFAKCVRHTHTYIHTRPGAHARTDAHTYIAEEGQHANHSRDEDAYARRERT